MLKPIAESAPLPVQFVKDVSRLLDLAEMGFDGRIVGRDEYRRLVESIRAVLRADEAERANRG